MSRSWYALKTPQLDPTIPANYIFADAKPTCINGSYVQVIYTTPTGSGGSAPGPLSINMLMYIGSALSSGVAQPSSPALAKKYVYLRP